MTTETSSHHLDNYREYLPLILKDPLTSITILEYIEPNLRVAVSNGMRSAQSSVEYIRDIVKKTYDITLDPLSLTTAQNSRKFWFLPGWFMMHGAMCAIMRVMTADGQEHHIFVAPSKEADGRVKKLSATIYDSGKAIIITSKDDLTEYMHINTYTELMPVSIAYPKIHRDNKMVQEVLHQSRIYFDIKYIAFPDKVHAVRRYISERKKLLDQYFENIESVNLDKLRFKSEFVLSSPREFSESKHYTVTLVKNALPQIHEDTKSLKMLRSFVSQLPLYRYTRRRKAFPKSPPKAIRMQSYPGRSATPRK